MMEGDYCIGTDHEGAFKMLFRMVLEEGGLKRLPLACFKESSWGKPTLIDIVLPIGVPRLISSKEAAMILFEASR